MEVTRKTIVIGAAALAVLALLILLFVVLRGGAGEEHRETPEYFDRELMIDEIEYRLPDVGARLIEPRVEYVVDPDKPFPVETARELEEDAVRSLEETLREDLEHEIERLIREKE